MGHIYVGPTAEGLQSIAEQSVAEQSVAGQSVAGQSVAGQSVAGDGTPWGAGDPEQPIIRVVDALLDKSHPRTRLHLSGSPTVGLPDHVREAALAASGVPGYAPSGGEPQLREAIAASLAARGITASPGQVLVTAGAMHALDLVFRSVLEPGDEVLAPAPSFFIGGLIRLAGGRLVRFPSPEAHSFRPSWAAAERLVTERTKILYVNTPVNPTGYVYDESDISAAAELAARHGLMLLSDESLSRFVYGGRQHVSPAAPGEPDSVLVGSFSKDFAMPGMRVGYAVLLEVPEDLAAGLSALLEWSVLSVSRPAQAAAFAAMTGPDDWLGQMAADAQERGSRLADELAAITGLSCVRPGGGLNVFPGFAGDAEKLASDLVMRFGVPVCPGSSFGTIGHFRLQFGGGWPDLRLAVRYVEEAVAAAREGKRS
jgi:aspartate/methionine/tyrosine aminotransferase